MKAIKPIICWALVTLFVTAANAETMARSNGQKPVFDPSAAMEQRLQRDVMAAVQQAQMTGHAPEGMGFLTPDSRLLPDAVKRAANSVFAIAVPAGDIVKASALFGPLPLEEVIRKLQTIPNSANFGPADRAIYAYQVNECIRQKVRDCLMFDGISYGTAFVTGDGRDLRTALHVVSDFSKNARAKRASGQIPVYLLGSNGQIVFGPHNVSATVAATYDGALDASIYEGKNFGQFNLDQVLIKLSTRIANPIPIADRALRDGEPAFIAGVAKRTQDRAIFSARDADGTSVRISRGTAMGSRSLMERLEKAGFYTNETATSQMLREGTAVTADGAPRSSGGAILNAKGEVVGVYNSGLPQSGAAFPFRVSYGGNSLIQP